MKYTIVAASLVLAACTSQDKTVIHASGPGDQVREQTSASAPADTAAKEHGIAGTLSRGIAAYEAVANGATQEQVLVTELMASLSSAALQDLGSVAKIDMAPDGDTYVTVNVAGQPLTIAVPRSGTTEPAPLTQREPSSHEAASLLLGEQATKMANNIFSKVHLGGRDAGKDTARSAPDTEAHASE